MYVGEEGRDAVSANISSSEGRIGEPVCVKAVLLPNAVFDELEWFHVVFGNVVSLEIERSLLNTTHYIVSGHRRRLRRPYGIDCMFACCSGDPRVQKAIFSGERVSILRVLVCLEPRTVGKSHTLRPEDGFSLLL